MKKGITVETMIAAPVDKVWEMYTDPRQVEAWNNASADWHTPRAENDLRPGGKFNYRMEARDGSEGFDFWGIYDEVIPNKLITYTMGDTRKASVQFDEKKGKTRVKVEFEPESENPLEMQKGGWQSILDNFKKHIEAK